ncbi:hypothetical protein TREMEDRAFT_64948 [Tremella mesenterica DSM 1558]|uniref:uncharacterized protein n=1 Tax=Tremella mesenterica (strain ATCC 24925 / CBS 8224 / DSM 1558 / NBRC 9311 / NRRL Y-6157 / RJB 2259-6 / UBC 559-6) TaxID=578456 RepID=UPI0003F48EAA|nr:uncharacterized protein TREMEDRAFT_64948 [Tremella mesenterica DSM 1558]EIW67079.1 hypothetical protein TREMEDRAFT_64948 [Tremella mesenterica DSM 1558]
MPAGSFNLRLMVHTLALSGLILLANFCFILALLIKPFSEDKSWSVACWTADWFWSYMQNHWETTLHANEALTITGDEIPKGESAVVISNHLGYADYYLVQALATRAEMLGRCRYFVKKQVVWQLPIFGFSFWAIGMILVSRNWTSDEGLIDQAFSRVKQNKHKTWIVLYPEGTRRTTEKVLQSQAFARSQGKKELERVLFPRTKGFAATIMGLRDSHISHIYDLTFLYTSEQGQHRERVPSLAEQLSSSNLARDGYHFHINVRRIPISDLPEDEAGLKRWCEEAWERKDELLKDILSISTLNKTIK